MFNLSALLPMAVKVIALGKSLAFSPEEEANILTQVKRLESVPYVGNFVAGVDSVETLFHRVATLVEGAGKSAAPASSVMDFIKHDLPLAAAQNFASAALQKIAVNDPPAAQAISTVVEKVIGSDLTPYKIDDYTDTLDFVNKEVLPAIVKKREMNQLTITHQSVSPAICPKCGFVSRK